MKNQSATKQVMLIFDEFSPPVPLLFLLAAEGYEVLLARNEQQVQDELVNGSKPDLVLLELQSNAIEILQLIQSAQPRIPVIVMAEPSLLNLALEIKKEFGAWEAVLKPFDFKVFRQLLQQALGGSPEVVCRLVGGVPQPARERSH